MIPGMLNFPIHKYAFSTELNLDKKQNKPQNKIHSNPNAAQTFRTISIQSQRVLALCDFWFWEKVA